MIDGREELLAEVAASPQDLKGFIVRTFGDLLNDEDFLDALPGHLYPDAASQARVPLIEQRMLAISQRV